MKRIVIGFFLLSLIVANAWAQFVPFDEIKKFDGRFINEVNLADSLLNYGVCSKLNTKTWFNLRPVVGVTDTAFSIRSSLGNTVVWADTLGQLTAKKVTVDSMCISSTGTSNNYLQSWWKNGVKKAYIDTTGALFVVNVYAFNKVTVPYIFANSSGTAAAPFLRWLTVDEDLGIYRVGPDRLGIAAKGANVATFDSAGVTVANTLSASVAKADTFKANYAVLWGPNLADYTVVATDSVASAGAASDTTGTRVYWRRYFSWDSVDSPSMKTGIYSTVFHLGTETKYKPDSLIVNIWFDGTHANADSGAAMIVVKGQSGTIVSSGWVTVAAASTWEHKGYVMATPFTRNEEYEILVYTKSVSGGRWRWSPPRFK